METEKSLTIMLITGEEVDVNEAQHEENGRGNVTKKEKRNAARGIKLLRIE